MGLRREFSLWAIMFVIVMGMIAFAGIYNIMTTGEAVLNIVTILLAFATVFLAYTEIEEGRANREHARDLADKDRRILWIKEQLEGLYSPLMAYIDIVGNKYQHTYKEGDIMPLMHNIRSKYEYLAENDLLKYLREYYNTNISNLNEEDWKKMIGDIIDAIGVGYSELIIKYSKLTS